MRGILLLACALMAPARAQAGSVEFDGRGSGPAPLGWARFEPKPLAAAAQASPSEPVIITSTAGLVDRKTLLARLEASDIVYVGERHDQASHHAVQLEILKSLGDRRPGLQLGLEMIERDRQGVLDDYLAGRLNDAGMREFWTKNWGYFELYRPLLEYARSRGIRLVGLNAPKLVMRQIYRGGLASLTSEQRAQLPSRLEPIRDGRYLAEMKKAFEEHAPGDAALQARLLEAQMVWNETMADTALRALGDGPLLVIAGSGHMIYNAGILESVRHRGPKSQATVLPYPLDGEELPLKETLDSLLDPAADRLQWGDFFWLLPK